MEAGKHNIPAFGFWNSCDELEDLYFQSASRSGGFIQGQFFREDGDLKATSHLHHSQKFQYTSNGGVRDHVEKQGKVMKTQTQRRHRIPKAVDEDLYKIPPELLYQKSKRRRCVRSFWLGCLGINCIP